MKNEPDTTETENEENAPQPASPQSNPSPAPKTPPAPFSLDFAAISAKDELTTWAEFKDGFKLEVRYMSRSELQKLSKKCTSNRFDPKTHQRLTELDPDKFVPQFVKATVRGWSGLTPNKLANLIRVDLSSIPEEKWDDEIAYSPEQMAYLMKNCYDLDTFLNTVVTDLTWFQSQTHAEEMGN